VVDLYEMIAFSASSNPADQKESYRIFLKNLCSGTVSENVVDRIVDDCWSNCTQRDTKSGNTTGINPRQFTELVTAFDVHTLFTVNL
jgi:hypothetical protein